MRCPSCEYESPFERVRCPGCSTTFDARLLEELGHLEYLQSRLREWQDSRDPAHRAAGQVLASTQVERLALERALGLVAPEATPSARTAVSAPARPEPAEPAKPAALTTPPEARASVSPAAPVALPPTPVERRQQVPTPPTTPPVEQPPLLAPPAEQARPVFAWSDVGTYLLSERTLHALLGLGAFLILASGVVISTVNPTNLGPLLHLAAVVATTLLFYLAGYVVRQKLDLRLTGTVLLAIGGAFIPLAIWTLGQEGLLNWQPGAIWLATSLFCLPLYLASHLLLRDRTFALLTSLAGGSQLLAALNWLGLPLEWGLCALLVLALGYLRLARRLRDGWPELAWALFGSTQVTTPLVLGLLLVTNLFPAVYEVAMGRAPGALYEYAVGAAWWLGTAFYALAARLFERRRYAFLAAWTLPFAFLLTLTRAPWEASWYNVGLALLALGYLGYGRWRQRLLVGESRPGLGAIVRQPAYQVSLALTCVALLWPLQSLDSRVVTLSLVTVLYALAAWLFQHVAFRYVASYLPPFALGFTLQRLDQLGLAWAAPAWQNVAYALLALGYLLLGRRLDRVWWASGARPGYRLLLVEPLFQVALLLTAVAGFWPLQARPGEIVTLLVLAVVYAAATFSLRQRAWAYVAVYLLPIAYALVERELQLQPDQRPLGWSRRSWPSDEPTRPADHCSARSAAGERGGRASPRHSSQPATLSACWRWGWDWNATGRRRLQLARAWSAGRSCWRCSAWSRSAACRRSGAAPASRSIRRPGC
jgi:hypothetical protein